MYKTKRWGLSHRRWNHVCSLLRASSSHGWEHRAGLSSNESDFLTVSWVQYIGTHGFQRSTPGSAFPELLAYSLWGLAHRWPRREGFSSPKIRLVEQVFPTRILQPPWFTLKRNHLTVHRNRAFRRTSLPTATPLFTRSVVHVNRKCCKPSCCNVAPRPVINPMLQL